MKQIISFRRTGLLLCLLLRIGASNSVAQNGTDYRSQQEAEYSARVKLAEINGRYIPKNIGDAMIELDKIVDSGGKTKFKSQPEKEGVRRIHFSFGKWMIVNWGFYEGSRLSHYLREKGITYPDDMADALMTFYHRHLNGQPLGIDEMALFYAEKRKKEWKERLQRGTIINGEK